LEPALTDYWHPTIPGRKAGELCDHVVYTATGIRWRTTEELIRRRKGRTDPAYGAYLDRVKLAERPAGPRDLERAMVLRGAVCGSWPETLGLHPIRAPRDVAIDRIAAEVLVVPRSERWREAVSTALVGTWSDPLWQTGHLPTTALGALKAEARALHRQLAPVWRRRTRHGRLLSLDANLGGLSLHDLVAAEVDLLAHTPGGVFEDERLNAVLRGLAPTERAVVFAYAEGEGTTWTEAATHVGAADPEAFGERIRRKAKRLAAEQRRRLTHRRSGHGPQTSLPVGPLPGTEE
jgi:hypothetical protein